MLGHPCGSKRSACWITVLILIAGCTTADYLVMNYSEETGITEYASRRTALGVRDLSAGLASGQRVMWQAVASCQGASCQPDEVTLILFNDSSRDLNLDYRGLTITTDGVDTMWSDLASEDVLGFAVPRGEFLRVAVSAKYFVRIVEANQVEVSFGPAAGTQLNVPASRRAAFRTLAVAAGMLEMES